MSLRCEMGKQSHKQCHEDVRRCLLGLETKVAECAAEQVTSHEKCVAQQNTARVGLTCHAFIWKIKHLTFSPLFTVSHPKMMLCWWLFKKGTKTRHQGASLRGRNVHLARGDVIILGKTSAAFVTSQRADIPFTFFSD